MKPLLLVLSALLAAPTLAAEKGSDFLGQAREDLKAGRHSKLDHLYEDSFKDKDRGRMRSYLTLRSLGVPANLPYLEKWAKARPKSPSAWAALGLAYLEKAKEIRKTASRSKEFKEIYEKAETYVNKAYTLSPKDINMSSFQIECRKVGGWGRKP